VPLFVVLVAVVIGQFLLLSRRRNAELSPANPSNIVASAAPTHDNKIGRVGQSAEQADEPKQEPNSTSWD
jgi:hypothetical protein